LHKLYGINNNKINDHELKLKYYELCKIYHPDNSELGSTIKYLEIKKAYDILKNPKLRIKYNDMTDIQNNDFNNEWNIEFHNNKQKVEKLEKYIKETINHIIHTL